MFLKKLSLLATVLACASLIEAAVIKQTKYFGEIAEFSQFDNSIGTLNSIRIDVTLNITGGEMLFDNDGSSPISGTIQFGAAASLTYTSDISLYNAANQMIFDNGKIFCLNSFSYNLAADNGDGKYTYDNSAPDGCLFKGSNISFSDFGYIGSAFWNSGAKGFIGKGTYNIIYSVNSWNDSIGPDIEYSFSPMVASDGSITVTYDYNEVPEPSVVSLFITGISLFIK
ncbi:MAG TPA: hypothetical protein DCP47_02005, partial [Phycisphaerales bacterium]|nr:hypothetical protein [Phycisphaerales bacterium]